METLTTIIESKSEFNKTIAERPKDKPRPGGNDETVKPKPKPKTDKGQQTQTQPAVDPNVPVIRPQEF
jgi:hypothetical protein